jgi:hypothetical protein
VNLPAREVRNHIRAEEMSVILGKLMGHGVLGALGESLQV